jgi:vancomycin resistance protein VanW
LQQHTQENWGACIRHNAICRKMFNMAHEQIKDEFITENHAIMMDEPLLTASNPERPIASEW